MSPTKQLLLLALSATAALAMPQFTATFVTEYTIPTTADGTFIASASAAAAYIPVIGGTAAGEIVTASSSTLLGGQLAGSLGPASGELGGTIANPQGGGTATGCIGGAVGGVGYTECRDAPFPKKTDLGQS